ncbi:MAG: PKD domain-containing protein, partial [Cyclobacteriaceae bacterium]|nr:PKD domain-containing protein [Cyclobacteriaceae bacterium]
DNTNPFGIDGFNPIDERPGRSPWDAQKSSANANDLRGKILRIRPLPDGTYEIPEGNLFPPGTEGTRPEIYAMGLRNPFRISIDAKRNWLYWGDVGPDARANNDSRGPKGFDEINQARKAGFWGWPYTRGNNIPYVDYNFDTTVKNDGPVKRFDPEHPVNDSPNNTGIKELPPIQKSLIWYSYDRSEEFPWVGVGGKNPMAGPVYYSDNYKGHGNRFPEYFDGKLFFYEWIRDWIFIVTLDEEGNFKKADPFMENSTFNNPIDMVFGRDGSLYILEYGEKWFAQNVDARLNKIEYVPGNRSPIAMISADKTIGAAPLTVSFSGKSSEDYDKDKLSYSWNFTGTEGQATTDSTVFTFEKAGTYHARLTVTDAAGQKSTATKEILVGNAPPEISIKLASDNLLFWDGRQVAYSVTVTDEEDGSTKEGTIAGGSVTVSMTYIPEGADLAGAVLGHQENNTPEGLRLIEGSDCKACHNIEVKVNGPSYKEIAARYTHSDMEYLVNKVYEGGSGAWGEQMMSAHPQHTKEQIGEMVRYILTTDNDPETVTSGLPLEGTLSFKEHIGSKGAGKYVLITTYTDKGANGIPPITERQRIFFTPAKKEAEDFDKAHEDVDKSDSDNVRFLSKLRHDRYFMYEGISTENLTGISIKTFGEAGRKIQGTVEVRIDKTDGAVIGEYDMSKLSSEGDLFKVPVQASKGVHPVYFVFKNETEKDQNIVGIDWVNFHYGH